MPASFPRDSRPVGHWVVSYSRRIISFIFWSSVRFPPGPVPSRLCRAGKVTGLNGDFASVEPGRCSIGVEIRALSPATLVRSEGNAPPQGYVVSWGRNRIDRPLKSTHVEFLGMDHQGLPMNKKRAYRLKALCLPAILLLSCSESGKFVDIGASSTLGAREGRYKARNLIDGTWASWCEGTRGPGIGVTVVLQLAKEAKIESLYVQNGYGDQRYYLRNNRVASIAIGDGKTTTAVAMGDFPTPQKLTFPALQTSRLELKLLGVFPSNQDDDTCLAEVSLTSFELAQPIHTKSGLSPTHRGACVLPTDMHGGAFCFETTSACCEYQGRVQNPHNLPEGKPAFHTSASCRAAAPEAKHVTVSCPSPD